MTRLTIAQTYARHLAEFTRRTPFGVLLKSDREARLAAEHAAFLAERDREAG